MAEEHHIYSMGKDPISRERDELQDELDQLRAGLDLYSAIDPSKVKARAVKKVVALAEKRGFVKNSDGERITAREWLRQYNAGVRINEIRERQKELTRSTSATTRFQEELEEIEDDEQQEGE